MVAFNFNANGVQPQYGGDAGLPDGKYPTVIVASRRVDVEKMGQPAGAFLELTHSVVDGPLKGQTMVDRLNLLHPNPVVVEIANKQLSAYCHALGVFAFQDTQQLHNIPMQIEVGRQVDKNTKQPTAFGEIKRIYDRNGNEPGKAAQSGPSTQYQPNTQPPPNQPPPAGVQADGGGWGGGQQGGQPQGQQGGYDPGNQGGGFGGGQGGNPPPPQDQGGGNWGAPAGNQGGGQQGGGFAPQGQQGGQQGGGWAPSGQGAGNPSWGQR